MKNIKVIGMHSNIHTNIILIGVGVEITVTNEKYSKSLFILLGYKQLLPK